MPNDKIPIRLTSRDRPPCRDCPDRYPACSGHCKKPEYLAWRAQLELVKKNRRKYEIARTVYDFKHPCLHYEDNEN